jgi:hypothetical protein
VALVMVESMIHVCAREVEMDVSCGGWQDDGTKGQKPWGNGLTMMLWACVDWKQKQQQIDDGCCCLGYTSYKLVITKEASSVLLFKVQT